MGIQRISVLAITLSFIVWVVLILEKIECRDLESPQYTVVHSESDFEIRFYRETVWMSAPSDEISFEKATKDGFHRLFQFIQGANLNFSRIPMTKPVLTSIVPGAGPLHSSAYFVGLYLPVKFQVGPPVPLPELGLMPNRWKSHCIAVRKFSGFARDNNIAKEAEKLAVSLSRSEWRNSTSTQSGYAYSIAQYNSPFKFIGRINEVWVDVNGSEKDGCKSNLLAAY
ncbi:heme-binding protein [Striga asiatica]|uniref:Heme-binding protein n=1 Tax=Striga asiatica TaxID=4170 RepID=A0A5A7RHX1_STRAF|nr:heme-binding protein [Striga asiatica]